MADTTTLTPQQQVEEQLKKVREQTQGFLSQVEKEGLTTKTGEMITPPGIILASEVGDVSTLPPLPYNPPQSPLNSITNIGADAGSLVSYYQQQATEEQKKIDEARKKAKGIVVPEAGREAKLASEQAKLKVPEMSAEVQQQSLKVASLKGGIDKLEVERTVELDKIYAQQGIGMRFISGQADEVNRKFDIKKAYASAELGAQSVLLQAQVGNLQLAQNMVDDIVNAYTFDIQAKRQDVKDLQKNYTDLLSDLTDDQRDTIDEIANRLEKEEATQRTEKSQIMNWMISYPTAGITLNDTVETAANKAQKASKEKEEVSTLTTFDDILQSAIDSGASPEQAAREAQFQAESQGLQLTPQMVERMKQRASAMKPTITAPTEITPTAPTMPGVTRVGETIRTKIGEALEVPKQAVKTAGGVISSFFGGLFGR